MPNTERASHSDLREKASAALKEITANGFTTYEEAADAAIAVCMEEAAKVAETMHEDDDGMDRQVKRHIATALRSLIPTSEAE